MLTSANATDVAPSASQNPPVDSHSKDSHTQPQPSAHSLPGNNNNTTTGVADTQANPQAYQDTLEHSPAVSQPEPSSSLSQPTVAKNIIPNASSDSSSSSISHQHDQQTLTSPSYSEPTPPVLPTSSSLEDSHFATESTSDASSDTTPRTTSTLPSNTDLNIQQRVLLKEQRLEDIKNQCSKLISELDSNQNPEAIVKKHISQLKKYNELKDIALGLVTMIADQRQLRTTDILEEMKVELKDD